MMFNSYVLAQVFSVVLLVISGTLFFHARFARDVMEDVAKHPGLQLLLGLLPLILGTLLVLGHSVWTYDFRMLVSLIGWAIFLSGVMRLIFVGRWVKCLKKCSSCCHCHVFASVCLVMALYLGYHGFHWAV